MFVDKNNFMQAFGLVGASHLNGKFGVIIEDASNSTNGRMTVQFWDETPAGFVDHPGPPKLVKPQNLKSVSIPMGKNHPGFSYLHGNEKVMVRVENGAGKSCVDCGCDLELNCFVFYNDEYRCEKDFAVSVGKSSTCEVCGDHLPLREVEHLPFGVMERYFPGKIPKDNPNSFSSYPVHRNCFVCCLCERYPSQDIFVGDQYPGPPHISELTGKAGFLCKKLPKSTTSCVEEYDDYLATKERQHVLEKLPLDALQSTLRSRKVPLEANESKESLVRKILVTDEEKGKKQSEVLPLLAFLGQSTTSRTRVTHRLAPLAVLRNRPCHHGVDEKKILSQSENTTLHHAIGDCFKGIASVVFAAPGAVEMTTTVLACIIENWIGYREMLLSDLNENVIPRVLWKMVVTLLVGRECIFNEQLVVLAQSLVIGEIMDIRRRNPRREEKEILRVLRGRSLIFKKRATISMGMKELIMFMHSPDRKKCDCLVYVATAAEIGVLRESSNVSKKAMLCALCGEALASPKVCKRCQKVAYCNTEHQMQHWKEHKKSCNSFRA